MVTNGTGLPSTRAWVIAISVLVISGIAAACAGTESTPSPAAASTALFIHADTVLGPKNLTDEEKPDKSCVFNSRFAHNEQVVWRVRVVDPATGAPMDDQALASLQLKLPDETLDLHYGGHPGSAPVDFFWTISWTVPEGYPTGTVDYTLVATAADGRTGEFSQFKVGAAMLTVTDAVRAVIAPAS